MSIWNCFSLRVILEDDVGISQYTIKSGQETSREFQVLLVPSLTVILTLSTEVWARNIQSSGFPGKNFFFICVPHLDSLMITISEGTMSFSSIIRSPFYLRQQRDLRPQFITHHPDPSSSSQLTQTSANPWCNKTLHSLFWNSFSPCYSKCWPHLRIW